MGVLDDAAVGQAVAIKRNRAAGEVEGAITSRADDLDAGRVAVDGRVANRRGQGRHGGVTIVLQECHQAIDRNCRRSPVRRPGC